MRKLIILMFWVCLGLTLASFGGALHGLGDSLAVFRFWWALGLSLSSLLLLRGHWRLAGIGAAAVVLAAAPMVIGTLRPNQLGELEYALYQKNLLWNGTDRGAIVQDILSISPDFITLQEISRENKTIYETLAKQYQSRIFCTGPGPGGIAVLSNYPLIAGSERCAFRKGYAALQVSTPDGPLWVVVVHLRWPFPLGQGEQVADLIPELEALDGMIVVGGDFNMVPWSHTMRVIEDATNSKRAGPVLRTFLHQRSPLRLPIDHILVPSGRGKLQSRPLFGSDHLGLLLRFNL